MKENTPSVSSYDLICVGGGIMSATLALMIKLIDPSSKILILERLDKVAQESTAAWNNAGTGHSALCELNYTPKKENGEIDVSKAVSIFTQFEQSKEFWSYLIEQKLLKDPKSFIQSVTHHSWVRGKEDVAFLKKRYQEMSSHFMFENMKFSEDQEKLKQWFPLIMQNRDPSEVMAATRMELGTGLDFETLTKTYFKILEEHFDTPVTTNHEVVDIDPNVQVEWLAKVRNLNTNEHVHYNAKHVFIGAGGGALPLLQKVEIDEKDGYGGFPVSGEWLYCKNSEVIKKHHAKVYSKAGPDAPPMSTPHLDTRHIKGNQELLFGPFAGFSTKFLKQGSYLDLFKSLNFDNLPSMWGVFWHNLPLTKYLIQQVSMTHEDRMNELRVFLKDAKSDDWELKVAGQRVQIIKEDEEEGGVLEFGTDVVHSKDGSITALLGASPGASTAVNIMLEVIQHAFPEKIESVEAQGKLSKMIPFWNKDIIEHEIEFKKVQKKCSKLLELDVDH
ncbi:malate dehydrogenase (quinone) [Gillisia mitskevichiae]|uniref:Probable malate:quinone oxidoreductase n=1 Tax=Gillisia mitskevichiae TaxID=270921 RepID=A0A495PWB9_9FLAO|nr:malate dehydrogenase (quinone) [Gillisia mitskevichiae]RKS53852.1 malate dehydrogenase (quinone) [Gillisia mitskevichiae]